MRQIERLSPSIIEAPPGRREVDGKAVDALARSIERMGLRTPITVRIVDNYVDTDGVVVDGQPMLVTGAHRLEAVRKLGLDKIECYIFDGDSDIDAELWEIDENLCRHELTPTEVAEHSAKRKELWEARRIQDAAESGSTCATLEVNGRGNEGFATDTAKASGQSKASVNRAVKRGNEVCQEARDLIRGTKLDTGAMLDKLVKMEPQQQVEYATDQINYPQERPVSRGVGIRCGHDAIAALKRIPLSDGLRQDAFDMVIDWIETNRGDRE
ncbi:ParB N-terminal domain-containing protein [Haliea sp. E1-2-M8]|uniref:ParB N-terminal domain-containing protein n=1 Tax=Haliea sp. E1-2-M8 TaxID=3064706 RepID=UPI00271DA587|nr:ParB N-terminal domain-containing protein [Haliea sp. E1-2-M8]MDO8864135.1 ParB N-terminal domain-containing protein [Haliea sp. E1-2-M8]